MSASELENWFPNLRSEGYTPTSDPTPRYNCIAWAAADDNNWWEPSYGFAGHYWPPEVSQEYSLHSYIRAFESCGYEVCDDSELEAGFEKIAIYIDSDGIPTHAARQLESGAWTSKLGEADDIEHSSLAALEGNIYGIVTQFLRRRLTWNKDMDI